MLNKKTLSRAKLVAAFTKYFFEITVGLSLFVGLISQIFFPWRFMLNPQHRLYGLLLVLSAIFITLLASYAVKQAKSGAKNRLATDFLLVTTGIYGYSRNPDYLALLLGKLGLSLSLDNLWWMLISGGLFCWGNFFFIPKQEIKKSKEFGAGLQ